MSSVTALRLKPYDCSSQEGRSKERYRRIALSSLTSGLAKFISILTTLVSVPLTLNYLGAERYGLWMTASSIIVVLGFSDLGMSSGLLNAIAKAHGNEDKQSAIVSVSSTFYLLSLIAIIITVVFFLIYPFVSWGKVFNVSASQAASEAGPAMMVLMMLFAINLPLSIVQRVQWGFQEGYVNDLYQIGGNILGLCGIVIATNLKLGLPWLIIFFLGFTLLSTLTNYIVQLHFKRRWLRPQIKLMNFKVARKIISNGSILLILTIMTLIGFQTDALFISHFHGAAAVADYSVVQKLSTIAILYWVFINALWPAYGEAFARNDHAWIKKTIVRSLRISIIGGLIIGGGLFFLGNQILKIWVGNAVIVDESLLLGFAVFIFFNGLIGSVAVVYNAGPLIQKQIIPFICATLCALLLKYFIAKHGGANYIIWSTTISFACFYLIPCSLMLMRTYSYQPNH